MKKYIFMHKGILLFQCYCKHYFTLYLNMFYKTTMYMHCTATMINHAGTLLLAQIIDWKCSALNENPSMSIKSAGVKHAITAR